MKRTYAFVLLPALIILALGSANVYRKAVWRDVTDGIAWKATGSGLRAIRVDPESEAFLRAGIRKGDILTAINKVPVATQIDVLKSLWQAAATDQSVTYHISKEGMQIYPTFYPQKRPVNPIYYYLVLVGMMTLALALIVLFNSRGQMSLPYVFFYLLAFAFAGFMVFSPTGEMGGLDAAFYGLDKLGFLAFPPLLLHFFMIFPLRMPFLKKRFEVLPLLYAPAAFLLLARVRLHVPLPAPWSEATILRTHDGLERLELLHFAFFALVTLVILAHSTRRAPNILVKKQLRIIVYGLAFGVVPFDRLLHRPLRPRRTALDGRRADGPPPGPHPSRAFAYSISRYRLIDIEVFLKKAATLIFSFFVLASVYLFVSSRTGSSRRTGSTPSSSASVAIVLGATLFTPLKRLFQALLDRAIYKRSYEYRKTLLSITRDLSRERNLEKLAGSLLEAIANALSLKSHRPAPGRRERPAGLPGPPGEGRRSGASRPHRAGRLAGRGDPAPGHAGLRLGVRIGAGPGGLGAAGGLRLLPRPAAQGRGQGHRLPGHGQEAGRIVLFPGGLGAADDDLRLGGPGPGERLSLQPGERPGPGDAAAQGLQREHHREPDRRRVRRRRGGHRHRLEPGPRGPGGGPPRKTRSAAGSRTSWARPPTTPCSRRRARRTSASSARSRSRSTARRRSSTSPGRRSSTTPCGPTAPSSSSRTSPTRSVSSSSS